MKTILAVLAGLLGTGILAYFCAAGHRDTIQQDLSNRTRTALAGAMVSDLLISADGREITLRGVVLSEQAKREAGETAKKISGVHTVTNFLEICAPAPLPLPPSPPVETIPIVPPSPAVTQEPLVSPPRKPPVQRVVAVPRPREQPQTQAPNCQKVLKTTLSGGQIQFETGKAALRPLSYPILDRLAGAVKRCAVTDIEISGHTDPRGSLRQNLTLSKNRAQSVIAYLIKKGVPAQRLTAIARGPGKPIASNTTTVGMQRNRRVELTIKDSRKKALQP